jgi:hypothetical protein
MVGAVGKFQRNQLLDLIRACADRDPGICGADVFVKGAAA